MKYSHFFFNVYQTSTGKKIAIFGPFETERDAIWYQGTLTSDQRPGRVYQKEKPVRF